MKFLEVLRQYSQRTNRQQAIQRLSASDSGWVSWSRIWQDVQTTVTVLRQLGVQQGNRVGILAGNSLAWILVDLACHQLHAVSVPLNTDLSQAQLEQQIQHAGISLLFVSPDGFPKVSSLSQIPIVTTGMRHDEYDLSGLLILGEFDEFLAMARGEEIALQIPAPSPHRIASIVYTSGTTGESKGVMLTEDNLVFNAEMALARYQFDEETHQFNFLPFFHAFGRTCDLYVWLLGGHRITLASDRQQAAVEVAQVSPTHINGVPYFFEKLKALCLPETNLHDGLGSSLTQINSGGAALNSDTYAFFEEQSVAVLEGYGLTETSPVAALNGRDLTRAGSVGTAIDQTTMVISQQNEVLIQGRHVCAGYYRDQQATNELIQDGWLQTGDLGVIDEDGFLFLTGRKGDLIVTSSGHNIWPHVIESLLEEHIGIEQAIVFGDRKKYLVAILFPNWSYFADNVDVSGTSDHWKDSPNVERWFQNLVDRILESRAGYERIGKLALLSQPLTADKEQLTVKGTLRRVAIKEQFADILDRLYSS